MRHVGVLELNYCSECDKKLTQRDKQRNRDTVENYEEWICWECAKGSDPE